MPNLYLLPDDYALYGVPDTTTPEQVIQASLIIDTLTLKPFGLLYGADANSNPAYMLKPAPSYVLTATTGITAGSSVTFPADGALQALSNGASYGQTVLVDRAHGNLTENCIIQTIDVINRTVTLSNVQFNHAPGTQLELGLSIFEEKLLPSDRAVTYVSYTPVRRVLGVQGQLTYPRRGDAPAWPYGGSMIPFQFINGIDGEPNLQTLNATQVQFNEVSGQLFMPATLYSLFYNDVRVYYISGWTYASLPSDIKQACGLIINLGVIGSSTSSSTTVSGPVTRRKAGQSQLDFANLLTLPGSNIVDFSAANLIKSLLQPYVRNLV